MNSRDNLSNGCSESLNFIIYTIISYLITGLKTILDSGTVNVNSLCRTEGLDPLTPLRFAITLINTPWASLLKSNSSQKTQKIPIKVYFQGVAL